VKINHTEPPLSVGIPWLNHELATYILGVYELKIPLTVNFNVLYTCISRQAESLALAIILILASYLRVKNFCETNTLVYFCQSVSDAEKKFCKNFYCGLCYKHVRFVNDTSSRIICTHTIVIVKAKSCNTHL
jgi:hypothetical protein